jgi:hypothetical protein
MPGHDPLRKTRHDSNHDSRRGPVSSLVERRPVILPPEKGGRLKCFFSYYTPYYSPFADIIVLLNYTTGQECPVKFLYIHSYAHYRPHAWEKYASGDHLMLHPAAGGTQFPWTPVTFFSLRDCAWATRRSPLRITAIKMVGSRLWRDCRAPTVFWFRTWSCRGDRRVAQKVYGLKKFGKGVKGDNLFQRVPPCTERAFS